MTVYIFAGLSTRFAILYWKSDQSSGYERGPVTSFDGTYGLRHEQKGLCSAATNNNILCILPFAPLLITMIAFSKMSTGLFLRPDQVPHAVNINA